MKLFHTSRILETEQLILDQFETYTDNREKTIGEPISESKYKARRKKSDSERIFLEKKWKILSELAWNL